MITYIHENYMMNVIPLVCHDQKQGSNRASQKLQMNPQVHSCIALLRIACGQFASAASHSHLFLAQA